MVMSVFSNRLTGHPNLGFTPPLMQSPGAGRGIRATTSRVTPDMPHPSGSRLWVIADVVVMVWANSPTRLSSAARLAEKHDAWAAAMSSVGLVTCFCGSGCSEYGTFASAVD